MDVSHHIVAKLQHLAFKERGLQTRSVLLPAGVGVAARQAGLSPGLGAGAGTAKI